jgi:hypothetical protein
VVELLHQHPERIVCAAGACKERQCGGHA